MAIKNQKAQATTANADAAVEDALQRLIASGEFAELHLERTMYKPEVCGEAALIGFPIQLQDMPPLDDGREWKAFVFLTTQPTKGVDREGTVVDVGVNEEIIIPATWQLVTALARFSTDPEVMYEVGIIPKTKLAIGGGKSMWTYRAAISKKPPTKRTGAYLLQQGAIGAPAALPPGDGTVVNAAGQPVASVVS